MYTPMFYCEVFCLQVNYHGEITSFMQEACQSAVNKISEKVRYIHYNLLLIPCGHHHMMIHSPFPSSCDTFL